MKGRRGDVGMLYPIAVVFNPDCVLFSVDAEGAGEDGGYGCWRGMAEPGAKFERERWVGRDGEDVGGDDLAGEYECLCGHWP